MKKFMKIGCLGIIGIIAIIVIFAVAGGGGGTADQENQSGGQDTGGGETEPAQEETPAAMGEPVEVGEVTYTIHSKETAETVGPEFLTEEASGIYVVVNATVKNNGNEAITVDSTYFKLKQGERTFEADSGATMSANEGGAAFFLEQVNPGSELTGNLVFDVSPEVAEGDLQLQVAEGIFGSNTKLINLQ